MELAVLSIIILIFSVILHEVAHGYMADKLGDPTARFAGRLTLNPIVHIDLFGSIILPAALFLSGSPIMFGWAKPVPYNPHNIRGRMGEALVALAGPATNLLLAIVFGLLLRVGLGAGDPDIPSILYMIVHMNVLLAIFNLLPIPPLDGSKIMSALLPRDLAIRYESLRNQLEQNVALGMGALIVFVLLFGSVLNAVVRFVSFLIVGV
ncbi:MAG: site-2 protease family protein [Minisyncoccia bacterium]